MPDTETPWPAMPTETEIYILPSGEIVVADLPAELAAHLAHLAQALSCAQDETHATATIEAARAASPALGTEAGTDGFDGYLCHQ